MCSLTEADKKNYNPLLPPRKHILTKIIQGNEANIWWGEYMMFIEIKSEISK